MKSLKRWSFLLLVAILLGGCVSTKVVYLPADSRVVSLKQGEPAPYDGVFLTIPAYQDLYEAALETWARREKEGKNEAD
jgi:hypothetical protein